MKFKASSSALLKQLSGLSGVLNTNNTLPILECFLFSLDKNDLKITASDLETTMTTSLAVESKDAGTIAIPARMLLDTLKAFPEQPLTFTIDEKKFSIELSSDNGKYKIAGHDGIDFPKVPEIESPSSFDIEATLLSKVIGKTLFAISADDLRPVMTGLFVNIGKDGTTFVSTDAHKLVRYRRPDVKSKKEASYIIPKKPLVLLKNILVDGKVKVEYGETNVSFSCNDLKMVSRLIDGKYPNYDAVIPKGNANRLTIDRQQFLSSIKRVSVFANKMTNIVKFSLKKTKMNIQAEDLNMSNEANEDVKCDYKGSDMEIGFNSKFLQDILNSIDGEEVVIELSEPNKAGIILPKEKEDDVLMLIMPTMLNQ